jgi:hypothetical protein
MLGRHDEKQSVGGGSQGEIVGSRDRRVDGNARKENRIFVALVDRRHDLRLARPQDDVAARTARRHRKRSAPSTAPDDTDPPKRGATAWTGAGGAHAAPPQHRVAKTTAAGDVAVDGMAFSG